MKIKYSSIIRIIIYFTAILMLGYVYLFDPILIAGYPRRVTVAIISIILAAFCIFSRGRLRECWRCDTIIKKYFKWYIPCVLIALIIAGYEYNYNIRNYAVALSSFCYVFLAVPVFSLFIIDSNIDRLIKKIALIEVLILVLKFISWYSVNYAGIVIFSNILKEYSGWSVFGLVRVEGGALFGLVFVYYFVNFIQKKKKYAGLIVVAMLLFMLFVSRFRFQFVALLATAYVVLYTNNSKSMQIVFIKRIILILVVVFFVVYALPDFVSSFGVDSLRGNSTKTRLIEITYFYKLMLKKNAFFGLGLWDEGNPEVTSLLTYLGQTMYFSDLGIIGAFFTFGVLVIPIYGSLFYFAVKTYKVSKNKISVYDRQMLLGVITYMIISNMLLNILDAQRAYAVPFYLSIIAYEDYKMKSKNI